MKLNPDCVRDVMLYLEEHLGYVERDDVAIEHDSIYISTMADALSEEQGYSVDEVRYAAEKLLEARYITAGKMVTGAHGVIISCPIIDISWNGHEFLNTIRPKSIWGATKEGAAKLGIMSIRALATISAKVAEAVITNPTVINQIIEQMSRTQ